ncbi:type 2 isopentenyl-diphosphate Delta-isomerase [Deinococcus irradiatisoli]|uniref:Isopentenyl-diphosphate delta-isomerase n=1 Tax=Deinococcus irradiatisoli TaxID=2202254 RepID=A0A2Z3JF80_9DEIO|nr:type 2 isopentenyl-diphosphate Delta-isomerase [Deinococcus irradiatisoli]AWN23692.1 type 2 isopentenyl-diphosphate Delta-isomerase [Deinococcus irradiatisoli]
MTGEATKLRKLRHIEACLRPESQYQGVSTGLEAVVWPYRALPELDLEQVDLSTTFLGKPLSAPVLIGAMTGGADKSALINRHLAQAAQRLGVGLMLGSQRVMLERPEAQASFQVRAWAPDALLIGNLGAAQLLKGYGAAEIMRAAKLIGADALAIHANPLQEALQPGGDTRWAGLSVRLREVVPQVGLPLLLKEVGHGLSAEVARLAVGAGFAALDVAGAGGTSWARVEELVRYGEVRTPDLCEVGLPTAQALREVRAAAPGTPLIASGGIRSGLDAARALLLGAQVVAVARPLLAPALDSAEAVEAWLRQFIHELRVALFVGGFGSVKALEHRAAVGPAILSGR